MPKINDLNQQPNLPELEGQVLKWWEDTQAFEKSVENRPEDNSYVFYDGPPFATGMPHYGHLLASTTKDVIPRYWTMKGYRVERIWGWDCHGLPIENMIEKNLKIKGGKKGIEELGIDKFNDACQREVLRLDKEWEKIIGRLGRWVDFENNYKTMDTNFMESVWWGFNELYQKGLVYEGKRVILYCPRCGTPLSNFEIAMDNSYEEVEDDSVYVKFAVKGKENEFIIAWTTTPWTLPGNVGLAVHPQAEYIQVEYQNEKLWVAAQRAKAVFSNKDQKLKVLQTKLGKELSGWEYEPLYNYLPIKDQKAHYVITEEFVSMEDGTGIVHTAAVYGEDDYQAALKHKLPTISMINDQGHFMDFVEIVAGKFFKQANPIITKNLNERNLLLRSEKVIHSYPHCYRCSTPLFYNAVPAWFIDVQKIKTDLLKTNQDVNWYPAHLKAGRFQKGLENAPDWNISRSRYWGTPMPIWRGEKDGQAVIRIINSIAELKKWAVDPSTVEKISDIHRQYIDDLEIWVDEDKTIKGKRIAEVFDCWVESGSMPFASIHYPFENKQEFEKNYPAQFVSEYIAQTRAWFYTMHVMSVGVFGKPSFENVLTTGTILAEDGNKMSKSKKNYPDPMLLIDKYGVDSLRLYLMSSTVMKGENLNFSEKEVADIRRKVFIIWWNVFKFYKTFANQSADVSQAPAAPKHVMDKWLLSKIQSLTTSVTTHMDNYDVIRASRELMSFVDELSTWYLRLSRDRIRSSENQEVSHVFGYAIYTLAQLMAPFAPFFTETLHHNLIDESTSIHHADWPTTTPELSHPKLETKMELVKEIVNQGRFLRSEKGMKLRQPLAKLEVVAPGEKPKENLLQVIAKELNVKQVEWSTGEELQIKFDFTLTPELQAEGAARELMREIQKLRKKAGLKLEQQVKVSAPEWPQGWQGEIEKKTQTKLVKGESLSIMSS
jgi:isoleucyl-tRNA synthetase